MINTFFSSFFFFFFFFFFIPFSSLISHLSHTMMFLFHEHEGFFVPDINFVVLSFIFYFFLSFLNLVEKQIKTFVNFLAMI